MKAVIFLCLLSVSLGIGKPTNELGTPKPLNVTTTDAKTQKITEESPKPALNNTELKPKPTENAQPTKETITESAAKELSSTTKPTNSENKTPANDKSAKENKVPEQTKTPSEMKPSEKSNNTTIIEEATAKKNETVVTTPKSSVSVSTTEPTKPKEPKDDAAKPALQSRGFDGASFVGGIILSLGLLAIGFMGFKYYKNQTERNYHTL
ncbi:porimin [Leptidea sinapis]|uniref:porimin n=1 Tax=Leptidea sinapis TaxID=189913 RepID=UPI002121E327|nr:porimin [Leptidea sinapis]